MLLGKLQKLFYGRRQFSSQQSYINNIRLSSIRLIRSLFETHFRCLTFRALTVFKKSRSSPPEVSLRKGILKICNKFTAEHQCRSVISINLLIEIALRPGYSPVNLLHIFRKLIPSNTSEWLLLKRVCAVRNQYFQKPKAATTFSKNYCKITR